MILNTKQLRSTVFGLGAIAMLSAGLAWAADVMLNQSSNWLIKGGAFGLSGMAVLLLAVWLGLYLDTAKAQDAKRGG